jgi:hypothetical protein
MKGRVCVGREERGEKEGPRRGREWEEDKREQLFAYLLGV